MVTAESLESVGKAAKFGGPALVVATTAFDMAMADNSRDRCIALIAGAVGGGGGWGGAEAGAATAWPSAAPLAVTVLASACALLGAAVGPWRHGTGHSRR